VAPGELHLVDNVVHAEVGVHDLASCHWLALAHIRDVDEVFPLHVQREHQKAERPVGGGCSSGSFGAEVEQRCGGPPKISNQKAEHLHTLCD